MHDGSADAIMAAFARIKAADVGRRAGFGLRQRRAALADLRAATGAHAFDRLCADLGIEHRLTPPQHPQTNGMVERFNGRIEEVLQSHHVRSGGELETTLHRYVRLYHQQLPQSAPGSKSPLHAMMDWHRLRPLPFKKQPYYPPGCDAQIMVEAIISSKLSPVPIVGEQWCPLPRKPSSVHPSGPPSAPTTGR